MTCLSSCDESLETAGAEGVENLMMAAASAYRETDYKSLTVALQALCAALDACKASPGKGAECASELDRIASRELLADSVSTWLCPMLMKPDLADAAEQLIDALVMASRREVMRVFVKGQEPLKVAVANSAQPDWTMSDGRYIHRESKALLELLLAGRIEVHGKRVLELGCGLGVIGLACARLSASRVLLTDYDPDLLEACAESAKLNELDTVVSTARLDWNEVVGGNGNVDALGSFDLLLAAGVVGEERHAELVVGVIHRLFHSEVVREAVLVTGAPAARLGIIELDEILAVDGQQFLTAGFTSGSVNLLRGDSPGARPLQWTLSSLPEVEPDKPQRLYRFTMQT